MSGEVALGWFSPHPPIVIPAVGKGDEVSAAATGAALRQAAASVAAARPDVLVVFGPHGAVFADAFTIESPSELSGNLGRFGAPDERVILTVCESLTTSIMDAAATADLPLYGLTRQLKQRYRVAAELDHGLLVPLWFLQQTYGAQALPPAVVINISGLSLPEHYRLGAIIRAEIERSGLRAVIVGSGDLSHRLSHEAPNGYHPDAQLFDQALIELFSTEQTGNLCGLEDLAAVAGECGLRPFALFLGCFDCLPGYGEVLSYEAPYGVGYLVGLRHVQAGRRGSALPALLAAREQRLADRRRRETAPARLARLTVEQHVQGEGDQVLESELSPDLPERAGVFVSIKQHGQLRGCIGTIAPTTADLREEIRQNAISAATNDPRFPAITADELPELVYSVDVLGAPEPIADSALLDPHRYGVIVTARGRQGLLLPDLDGVDSVEEQISIAKQKAGLRVDEPVQLARFTVTRWQ